MTPALYVRLCALFLLAGPALAQTGDPALDAAVTRYPPFYLGANVHEASGTPPYAKACPDRGRVEAAGQPATEYLGEVPGRPGLCRMRIAGQGVEGWQAIWLTAWPGAAQAAPNLQAVIQGKTGTLTAFDVRMAPGLAFHDVIRNEGIEDIRLLGVTYHAVKFSHYREGFDGNTYRSVSTVWKDIPTGMIVYGTYNHIAGQPELDNALTPTAIVP